MRNSVTDYSCNQYTFIGGDCVLVISLNTGDEKKKTRRVSCLQGAHIPDVETDAATNYNAMLQ